MRKIGIVFLVVASLELAFAPGIARATLGQGVSPGSQLETPSGATPNYLLRQVPGGTEPQVREFVAPASMKVFGAAWNGDRLPDLKLLLGSYYPEFRNAIASHSFVSLRFIHLVTPNLIFDNSGHPGALHGRVYIPAMVPAGVRAEDIVQ